MDQNEIEILKQLKQNNREAYRKLYFLSYQPLLIFASKFVDKELAKDFVQDCFYNLWQNRMKVEINTSLSAYLFTVIKNRCFKHLKDEKKKIFQQNNYGIKLKEEELTFFINSEKSILEFDIKDRIDEAVSLLPEKCRNVFIKSRFQGLSNKEIADQLDISLKTVEKHLSKALKLFREKFKDLFISITLLLLDIF